MTKPSAPELKRYMDKRVLLSINNDRKVSGILRGYDPFINLVLDDAVVEGVEKRKNIGSVVIRGNSVLLLQTY